MKNLIKVFVMLSALLLLTGCSKKNELTTINIGNLTCHYDSDVWGLSKTDEGAPLELKDSVGNLLTISVSQESTYQHPLDMINFLEEMISTKEGFQVFLKPTKIDVNGTNWYEYGYSFIEGSEITKVYQRYYGKNYNAASISFTSTDKNYEAGLEEALKIMSDVNTTNVSNDANEAEARQFLVGEWEVKNSGYLVLKDDGTYDWYKDSTKDPSNKHHGTYGCDVENATMQLNKGDGVYLVLFPEELIRDGSTEASPVSKMDYIISFDMQGSEGYPMVNMASYKLYTLIKQ